MPTYEYEILDRNGQPTGERFEVVQSMKDEAWVRVPTPCNHRAFESLGLKPVPLYAGAIEHAGKPCRRVISAPRFRIKEARARNRKPAWAPTKHDRRESLTHFFPNVDKARKELPGAAHLIQPDGTVRYQRPSDELVMKREFEASERRKAQQAAERTGKAIEIKKQTGVDPFRSTGRVAKGKIPDALRKQHRIS